MSITLAAIFTSKVGFASHQNAVPIVRELKINNGSETDFENLTLTLTSSPSFLEPKTWHLDRLTRGDEFDISDRDARLNADYLFSLSESVRGELILTLAGNDTTLAIASYPIEVLAKNEWGGVGMSELIAAFVMPNDIAVDKVLKTTSDVLRRAGKKDSLDGYTAESRRRSWELTSALWSAIGSLKLSYALPPASFETQGQKIRTPSAILDGMVATCLDSALLFAAAIEQLGMNPVVVFTEGHAFVGVWLQPQEFSTLLTEDVSAIRKRIDLQEMVVFETTLVTKPIVPTFTQAIETARSQLTDHDFIVAVDIRRARMQRIRPLALAETKPQEAVMRRDDVSETINEALEEAPNLPSFDVDIPNETSSAPAGKLAVWQRKLLDLTTRNRLLHLPAKSKSVKLLCPDPAALEDKLAEGKRIRIVPMPNLESAGRDADLYQQQNSESLYDEYARDVLSRGEVLATEVKEKLETLLVELYRKARNDIDEGGSNTLFLAIGFLKWKKSADEPRAYSAPLILLPIQLERRSALSGVTMRMLEDEPRFNLTLLELLRHDFSLSIPGLDGELPTDESGIDVPGIWNMVRRAVRDIPGFEVVPELVIGTFSFAKYLMWKDLVDRSAQLMQNAVVKCLLERSSSGDMSASDGEFVSAKDLDSKVKATELFLPLPADSSQIAAIAASANGKNFVLDGPPGTGKSQTIANMIAHNLALGRRVLFVAEKRAALDVVYRRLEEKGLGEFCVELHSSKTSKVDFLKQLERAWDTRDVLSADEWLTEGREAQRLRDRLNGVVGVLHKIWPNGLTVHQAIGRVIRDADEATPKMQWPVGTHHDRDEMTRFRDVARRLDLNSRTARALDGVFGYISRTEWSNGWQESLVALAHEVPKSIDNVASGLRDVHDITHLTAVSTGLREINKLIEFVSLLLTAHNVDLRFMFSPNVATKISTAQRAMGLVNAFRTEEKNLSVTYTAELYNRINLEQLENDWKLAEKKLWFFASMAKKKVTADLATQGGTSGSPDVVRDLITLRKIKELISALEGCSADVQDMPGWDSRNSDVTRLAQAMSLCELIRTKMSAMATSASHLAELHAAVSTLIVNANGLLDKDGNLAIRVAHLKSAITDFDNTATRFSSLIGHQSSSENEITLLRETAVGIVNKPTALKSWCDWCRVRDEANAIGLQPLAEAMARKEIPEGQVVDTFETAYARWFAAWVIDAEPLLHNFVPAEHMSDIEAYRKQDERLSQLAVRYIRAKLCGHIPAKNDVGKIGGYGVLKHELQKSRRHKPIRQLATEMGSAMSTLAPCMLMSPLSIAQYLPANQSQFDLVIFDEASQITPWDAVGSIARGKQVVIAGDPRQMPPTNFFGRGETDAEDDTEEDMESILDECLAAGIYNHSLSWHYRSRHESLIAFSNHRYYDSNLITFPAAQTKSSMVEWRKIDGIYAKGKGRHNQAEAEAIVAETVKRLTDPEFIKAGRSIGIITLNSDQQRLISDLLDRERQQNPAIEAYFQDDLAEPVIVKNLETVQGDERDIIMLGICYGPTAADANTMSMNFGPLNKEGGWRRLNVAITRARCEMLVFTSFDPSLIDLNRTSARAVQDLKHFIEFAQRGPVALAQAIRGSLGGYESPFEEAVANGLRQKGWNVVPQIGVSRFRIDLGIVHPDHPGDYLVGVECDGASYHSAATARDRDKVRSAILRGLGWKLVRVWSTDWWVDKQGSLERLHAEIDALLEASRALESQLVEKNGVRDVDIIECDDVPKSDAEEMTSLSVNGEINDVVSDPLDEVITVAAANDEPVIYERKIAHKHDNTSDIAQASDRFVYRQTDFSAFTSMIDAEHFYADEYEDTLRQLVTHTLEQEAPILDSLLVQRIARLHGFGRAGRLIRTRVLEIIDKHHFIKADKIDGDFVWISQQQSEGWHMARSPETDDDMRSMNEIAYEEIVPMVDKVHGEDKAAEIAKGFGFKRVTSSARERIEAVMRAYPLDA